MPSIQSYRLADLNVNYKVRDILVSAGILAGKYRIIDGYPNSQDLNTTPIWPTISIEIDNLFGRDVELGSEQWKACQIAIDIFANTDSQRDDIATILFDGLNEKYFNFYDFNTGFSSSANNYTGISSTGQWTIDNMSGSIIYPSPDEITIGEKHHMLLDGILMLPPNA